MCVIHQTTFSGPCRLCGTDVTNTERDGECKWEKTAGGGMTKTERLQAVDPGWPCPDGFQKEPPIVGISQGDLSEASCGKCQILLRAWMLKVREDVYPRFNTIVRIDYETGAAIWYNGPYAPAKQGREYVSMQIATQLRDEMFQYYRDFMNDDRAATQATDRAATIEYEVNALVASGRS